MGQRLLALWVILQLIRHLVILVVFEEEIISQV